MKKSLLIILVLLSFTLNVNAEWYNPMDWGQSEQDERIEDIEDDSDNISDLGDRLNQLDTKEYKVSDPSYCIQNPGNCNDNYERDATEEENINLRKEEQVQIENKINELSTNIGVKANEYISNNTALEEYRKKVSDAESVEGFSDAQSKQKALEEYNNAVNSLENKTKHDPSGCITGQYECDSSYNRELTEEEKKSELDRLNSTKPSELTEEEKKLLDDYNIAKAAENNANQIVEDGGVLMTEDQKKVLEEKQKNDQIEAQQNNEAAIKANNEAIAIANENANPGLKTLGNADTMNALLGITDNKVLNGTDANSKDGGFTVLSKFTVWFKNTLTGLVQLIAVGALLFVGIRLAFARGNPEEFKKALVHMVYVIVGIFVIAVSWAAVVLVAGINI